MDKHELEARIQAESDEWRRNIDIMKAKAETATGERKLRYRQDIAGLERQFDELKIQAAKTWDIAEDKWDEAAHDLELKWKEFELKAREELNQLVK